MSARHVIIGGGPASIAAAETIHAIDPSAGITVITDQPFGYYSKPGLAYFLADEVPEQRLYPFSAEELAAIGVVLEIGRAVTVEPEAHVVRLADGRQIAYDRLLIATGARALPLSVPGAELRGVVKLDDLADARALLALAKRGTSAVVVGGGITALEIVEALRRHHVDVHYVMRRERYWGNVLSLTESRLVEDALADDHVRIHRGAEIARVVGSRGQVSAVATSTGESIPAAMLAVAIGVEPCVELARDSGIECGRGILVDEFLRTSADDVFAAGDAAEVADPTTGRRALEILWSSAVEKGRVAGRNMVEGPVAPFLKRAPMNVTRIAGFRVTIIGAVGSTGDADLQGITRGDSESWRRLGKSRSVEHDSADTHLRLELADGVIAGAVVIGEQALTFPLQELIAQRTDISAIAEQLSAPGADLSALLGALNAAVHA